MSLEQQRARYREHYQKLQEARVCQGRRPKTIDADSRGVRRVAGYFKRCPDDLTPDELKRYFADWVTSPSGSPVKRDRNGIQFYSRHVLDKPGRGVELLKPPGLSGCRTS